MKPQLWIINGETCLIEVFFSASGSELDRGDLSEKGVREIHSVSQRWIQVCAFNIHPPISISIQTNFFYDELAHDNIRVRVDRVLLIDRRPFIVERSFLLNENVTFKIRVVCVNTESRGFVRVNFGLRIRSWKRISIHFKSICARFR